MRRSSFVAMSIGLFVLFSLISTVEMERKHALKRNDEDNEQHQQHHHTSHHAHHNHHQHGPNDPYIDGDELVNATRGKSISMTCIVHNLKSYKITWYFKGTLLALDQTRIKNDKRYSIQNPRPNEWKLIIDSVEASDEGHYSCRLPKGQKRFILLRVGTPPRFIGNNGSHQIVINAVEKQNVTLHCEAEGSPVPSIYWYKSGKQISVGPHLHLRDINRHSHLEYECVARNTIEPDSSRHFKINVNYKPTIQLMYHLKEHSNQVSEKIIGESNEMISDGDLEFICEVDGNPINSISWFKDKTQKIKDDYGVNSRKSLSNNMRKQTRILTEQIGPNKYNSKLKIRNYDSTDNGEYECRVDGFGGESFKAVTVNEIPNTKENENKRNEYSLLNDNKESNKLDIFDLNDDSSALSSVASSSSSSSSSFNDAFSDDEQLRSNQLLIESNHLQQSRGARSNSTNLKSDLLFDSSAHLNRPSLISTLVLMPIVMMMMMIY